MEAELGRLAQILTLANKMALGMVSIIALILVVAAAVPIEDAASTCNDIDTSACVLLAAQKPNFCAEPSLSETACPRYCKLCPVHCYHCNTTVTDFHMCNTKKLCASGEICMRKQLNSVMDGHVEYQLSCARKQTCDGLGLVIPFGKRSIESRDISISCCDTDVCNYPTGMTMAPTTVSTNPVTTAHGCKKDVLVIVDESNSLAHHSSDVFDFLDKVFSTVTIGQNEVLMSLTTFHLRAVKRWDLDEHTTNADLSNALSKSNLNGGLGDLNAGINFAVQEVNHVGHNGNRGNAPDVVIIVTDDDGHSSLKENALDKQLRAKANNVIAIGIGHHVTTTELLHLATDANHEFSVHEANDLEQLYKKVAGLICQ